VPVTEDRPNKAWCAIGEVEIFAQVARITALPEGAISEITDRFLDLSSKTRHVMNSVSRQIVGIPIFEPGVGLAPTRRFRHLVRYRFCRSELSNSASR